MSDPLRPHGLQHTGLPCPSPSPGVSSNPCPLSRWCHPTTSHPLSPHCPPALNLSKHQGLFQWVGSSYQMAKLLKLQFSISPSNEYSGLISFRIDWFDLLAVQGILKSLLLNHNSKASSLQHSAFCMVQLSHPYMITKKNIQTFVGKAMSSLLIFYLGLS